MKSQSSIRNLEKQKGATMMEVILGLLLVAVAIGFVMEKYSNANNATIAHEFSEEISVIAAQARTWKIPSPHYTGISITELTSTGMLDSSWGAGTGVNPAGGNYTVAVNTTDATILDITATGLSTEMCANVARKVQARTVSGSSASCSGGTLTAKFR